MMEVVETSEIAVRLSFGQRPDCEKSAVGRLLQDRPRRRAPVRSRNRACSRVRRNSANNRLAPDFMARAASAKNFAAEGISCTTANARTKSAEPS